MGNMGGLATLQPGWGNCTLQDGWMVLVTKKRKKQVLLQDLCVAVRKKEKKKGKDHWPDLQQGSGAKTYV